MVLHICMCQFFFDARNVGLIIYSLEFCPPWVPFHGTCIPVAFLFCLYMVLFTLFKFIFECLVFHLYPFLHELVILFAFFLCFHSLLPIFLTFSFHLFPLLLVILHHESEHLHELGRLIYHDRRVAMGVVQNYDGHLGVLQARKVCWGRRCWSILTMASFLT